MQARLLTIFGVLASVLLIAILALVITLTVSGPAQAQPTGAAVVPQVTVVGRGEVTAQPDTAYVQIGVETQAETTQAALEQNNTQTAAVIARLKELGIDEQDIQTSNFNIYATYDERGSRITGYNVSNTVSVKIRNLEQTGALLDEVVQLGANRVYGIGFGVDDPTGLIDQARDRALTDARRKAEQLAQSSGTSLGQVIMITENIGASPPPPLMLGRGDVAEEAASAVPVEPGEQSFSTQVQVTFELR